MATAYSDFYDAREETSSDKPRLNLKQVLRRRYREATALALVVLVIGLAATFGLPAQFRSQAIILIEQQDIPGCWTGPSRPLAMGLQSSTRIWCWWPAISAMPD